MFSGLPFRSSTHFEFTFVYTMRKCSNLIVLHADLHFSPALFIKHTIFSPLYILAYFFCRLIGHKCAGLFMENVFCSIDLCVCFCDDTILF